MTTTHHTCSNHCGDSGPGHACRVVPWLGLVELLDHCHAFLDTHQTARVALEEYCRTAPQGLRRPG